MRLFWLAPLLAGCAGPGIVYKIRIVPEIAVKTGEAGATDWQAFGSTVLFVVCGLVVVWLIAGASRRRAKT